MFTINFKRTPCPKDGKLVKLDMILFQTGYLRVSKSLNLAGRYEDWDQVTQNSKMHLEKINYTQIVVVVKKPLAHIIFIKE